MTIFFTPQQKNKSSPQPESDYDRAFREAVEEGLKDAREGRLIPHEQIEKNWEKRKKRLLDK